MCVSGMYYVRDAVLLTILAVNREHVLDARGDDFDQSQLLHRHGPQLFLASLFLLIMHFCVFTWTQLVDRHLRERTSSSTVKRKASG